MGGLIDRTHCYKELGTRSNFVMLDIASKSNNTHESTVVRSNSSRTLNVIGTPSQ